MKENKYVIPGVIVGVAIVLMIALFTLLNLASTQHPANYSDTNFNVMTEDIQTVVCSVKNQTVMTQENVDDFYGLSARLNTYTGSKEQQVAKVSGIIKNMADNWSATVGLDLGVKNAEMLTELCESVQTQQ